MRDILVSMNGSRILAVALGASLTVVLASRTARADAPAPELMTKLAAYAANFEKMKTHASYAVNGKMETVDGDGATDSVKSMSARLVADGSKVRFVVVKYEEDGKDKTADAREKAAKNAADKDKQKEREKRNFKMPFFATEQARYTFDQAEVDPQNAARVRITFVPKVRAEDTIEGSAWVDSASGTPTSAGFKLSMTPAFVDYVHITCEFGTQTSLGPAVTRLKMDGRGGILFFRKSFRVDATISDYVIVP